MKVIFLDLNDMPFHLPITLSYMNILNKKIYYKQDRLEKSQEQRLIASTKHYHKILSKKDH